MTQGKSCDAQHYKCFEHSGDSNEFYAILSNTDESYKDKTHVCGYRKIIMEQFYQKLMEVMLENQAFTQILFLNDLTYMPEGSNR